MADTVHSVHVRLGERSYEVLVGPNLLHEVATHIRPLTQPGQRLALVADQTVDALYGDSLADHLSGHGFQLSRFKVPAGERSKAFNVLEQVCRHLLQNKIERGDLVLSLGGGVIGDLVGFASAIVRRGVRVVHLPTSLLAQVDSSVGGKTGINTPEGKNLIGAFHQPSRVIADTNVLDSLSERHKRAGYAEIIKYALLGDYDFFEWLEKNRDYVLAPGSVRGETIARSVAGKAGIVARDETEQGERALLNLGHTFGHALEAVTGYSDVLLHGEAVSIGLVLALGFSREIGWLDGQSLERARQHLIAMNMPDSVAGLPEICRNADVLVDIMMQDKKVTQGHINLVLLKGLGQADIAHNVDPERLHHFLNHALKP